MNAATDSATVAISDIGIKFLAKIAKKQKGTVHIPSLLEIAPLLGWTVTRAFIPRAGWTLPVARAFSAAIVTAGGSSPYRLDTERQWFRAFDEAKVSLYTHDTPKNFPAALRASLPALGTVLPKKCLPPVRVDDDGVVFFRDATPAKDADCLIDTLVWTSTAGYLVECDGVVLGAVFPGYDHYKDGRIEESDEADKPGSVWTWAYKAGADRLAAEAIVALGDEATRRRRPEHPAGDEHTGHCQICRRAQKMKGYEGTHPILVDHGYTHEFTGRGMRDGGWGSHGYLGQRQGSCYGVGYLPWEVDSSRLRWFRDTIVEPGVLRLRSYLKRLNAGEVKSITVLETEGYGSTMKVNFVTYTPESTAWPKYSSIRAWKDLLAREIDDTQHELTASERHLARIDADLAGWKRTPLYDELHPATA